ncbi:MAG: hypothetical protein P4L98_01015 [Ancalomicrobiaceae bacterium]|nr:hypothetical protein [Ancalomicrobiaceae bacterium]
MFHKNFRVVISQYIRDRRSDSDVMVLNAYKADVTGHPLAELASFANSSYQFQGRWAYQSSNSTGRPTLGNAAPPQNRFWRYNLYQKVFKFVTIGQFTDGEEAVDECAELYDAEPDSQTGIAPSGGASDGKGFILRQSSFFWRGAMTWESENYFSGQGYEP